MIRGMGLQDNRVSWIGLSMESVHYHMQINGEGISLQKPGMFFFHKCGGIVTFTKEIESWLCRHLSREVLMLFNQYLEFFLVTIHIRGRNSTNVKLLLVGVE